MARSLSNVKVLSFSFVDGLSLNFNRAIYASNKETSHGSCPTAPDPPTSCADFASLAGYRRGYAAASQAGVTASMGKGESTTQVVEKVEETVEIKEDAKKTCSWGPDPVTGYYKPTDHAAEIGTAELREMALNHKIKPPH